MDHGRLFKRSADARINTYNRPESSAFCQLANRPAQGTPYAKYDRMMSRFEALDGVLCFAYAQWYMESWSNKHDLTWWQNSVSYFELARTKHMEGFAVPGPKEEALLGIQYGQISLFVLIAFYSSYLFYVKQFLSGCLLESKIRLVLSPL
jgi:hypothetical protein